MTGRKIRVGVLVSGRGSTMLALVKAAQAADYPAEIVLVASNRPDALALSRANNEGLATLALDHRLFDGREAFEAALTGALEAAGVELVCLAGFMRVLSPFFVRRWQGRLINIHPSLLPAFKGLHTHERALEAGARLHGATVHFVTEDLDDGPIVAQGALIVRDGESADELAARVLADIELKLYPLALAKVAASLGGDAPPLPDLMPGALFGY